MSYAIKYLAVTEIMHENFKTVWERMPSSRLVDGLVTIFDFGHLNAVNAQIQDIIRTYE
jgi:hypothetical protein